MSREPELPELLDEILAFAATSAFLYGIVMTILHITPAVDRWLDGVGW